jgi:hypothetical protein
MVVQTRQFGERLTVEFKRQTIRPGDGSVIFSEGVVARYGLTVIRSDTLTILYKEGSETSQEVTYGKAEGNVTIEDPEGIAKASIIEFDWGNKSGYGRDLDVTTTGMAVKAREMERLDNKLVFSDVVANPTVNGPVYFSTREMTINSNGKGIAKQPSLHLFGKKVLTLPSYRFGKRDDSGLRLPNISYNRGFGISWRALLEVDDRTRFLGAVKARKGEGPGINLSLSRSLLPRGEDGTELQPLSDLNERFPAGFFDSVRSTSPKYERASISTRRSSIGIGAAWNQAAVGRLEETEFSKPFELISENGRNWNGLGVYSQLRYQQIHESSSPKVNRLFAGISLLAPDQQITPQLNTHLRVDSTGYLGGKNFSWAQVQAGLVYRPLSNLRIGGAVVQGAEFGTPDFVADRLFSTSGMHWRADIDFGSTVFSYLGKYDFNRGKWYDNEIGLRQVIGSLEPYITYREFPRSFSFGVKLRLDQTIERLTQRAKGLQPSSDRLD